MQASQESRAGPSYIPISVSAVEDGLYGSSRFVDLAVELFFFFSLFALRILTLKGNQPFFK